MLKRLIERETADAFDSQFVTRSGNSFIPDGAGLYDMRRAKESCLPGAQINPATRR